MGLFIGVLYGFVRLCTVTVPRHRAPGLRRRVRGLRGGSSQARRFWDLGFSGFGFRDEGVGFKG